MKVVCGSLVLCQKFISTIEFNWVRALLEGEITRKMANIN